MKSTLDEFKPILPNDLSKLLELCVDQLNDAILITEAEPFNQPGPRIVWANKVFYDRHGYTPNEVIGRTPRMLQGPKSDRAVLDKIRASLEKWQPIRSELINYRKDGSSYWNEFQIVPIANDQGRFTHWVSIQRDVTERKNAEAEVRQLAFYDSLTKLPNRRLLDDRLDQIILAIKRTGCYSAIMFLDLDHFKQVNDTYGHAAGDQLLIQAATRLKCCVREMDTVSRFGGDEFVVLLTDLDQDHDVSISQAKIIAEKIRSTLSEPYYLTIKNDLGVQEIKHCCNVTIGVDVFYKHEVTHESVMKHADHALYQAKEAGRNQIRFYGE